MSKVSFIEVEEFEGKSVTHAVIEHEDGSFTSMTKEHYESQQAEQSTPMVTDADKS
jgi:hypothetical protein